jgi:peptidoglycan hydrolase-like protein with peptidoglycan-binding domain
VACATCEAAHHAQEQALVAIRYTDVTRFVIFTLTVVLAVVAAVSLYRSYAKMQESDSSPRPEALLAGWTDDNVREVQTKLREGGFYSGEIDGAYSSELAAAIGRYQIRNGLPITGQLDEETSKALGAKPAVTTTASDRAKSAETWRRLRTGQRQTLTSAPATSSPRSETPGTDTEIPPRSAPAATTPIASDDAKPSAQPATAQETTSSVTGISMEQLRDYVGAFVLAGLDPHVGSETDFFADRDEYYDEGVIGREKIRNDLKRYAARWPDRRFWLDGDILVEPQSGNRVRVSAAIRLAQRRQTFLRQGQ